MKGTRLTKVARRIGEAVLTVAAALGLSVLLLIGLTSATGWRAHYVASGSMEPEFTVGALLLSKPVQHQDITVGDIITVTDPFEQIVTHRVIAAEHDTGQVVVHLKGDANKTEDPFTYTLKSAHTVQAHVPLLGGLYDYLSETKNLLWVAAIIVGALGLTWQGRPDSGNDDSMTEPIQEDDKE